MTSFTTLNFNISSMKFSINSVPGYADAGSPNGDGGMAPGLHPDVWRGEDKVSNGYYHSA